MSISPDQDEGCGRSGQDTAEDSQRAHTSALCFKLQDQYIDILSAGLSDVTMTEAHDRLSGAKVILINTFIATLLFDWQHLFLQCQDLQFFFFNHKFGFLD